MSLRYAWAFLTRLPGGAHPDDERGMGRSVPWFPVVGALLGLLVGFVYWGLFSTLGPLLAAVLAVTVGVIATGAFHEDGLADTADGLGGMAVERRLGIMKDSRVGTFGSLALMLATLGRIVALSALGPMDGWIALVLAHTIGRCAAVVLMISFTPASAAGLARSYSIQASRRLVVLVAVATSAAAVALGPASSVGLFAAACGMVLVGRLARQAFGGTTGDVLGATEQVGELSVLVAAAGLVAEHGWAWG